MEFKKNIQSINTESLKKIDDYLSTKKPLSEEQKQKISHAKKEWQEAWNKFEELLLILEHIEI